MNDFHGSGLLRGSLVAVFLSALLLPPGAAAPRVDHEAACTYKTLSWDDFRGPVISGQQVAWIAATIVLEPFEVEVVQQGDSWVAKVDYPEVYALMDKLQSSARRGGRTESNLAHEQTHFDIAEYEARKLALEVREVRATGEEDSLDLRIVLQEKVSVAYAAALRALLQHQQRYDSETRHGTRKKPQKKWQREVTELLEQTEPYKLY